MTFSSRRRSSSASLRLSSCSTADLIWEARGWSWRARARPAAVSFSRVRRRSAGSCAGRTRPRRVRAVTMREAVGASMRRVSHTAPRPGPSASGASGKWVAQVAGRDGQTHEQTINLKEEGEKLTGTVSGRQGDVAISEGRVKGDEVSFNVTMSFQGREMRMAYKGKLTGDEIKFTRQREGSDHPTEFT